MIHSRFMNLIWAVILFIVLSGTGSADSAVVLIPPGSWIYAEMSTLVKAGYIDNYPEAWVKSGNTLSRFEMAYYIKRLLTKQLENISAENLSKLPGPAAESLQRLIAEFERELVDLGLKITDIDNISPQLAKPKAESEGYMDLDLLLTDAPTTSPNESYYYYGQYYWELEQKSFLFIPNAYLQAEDLGLLESELDGVNVVYQPSFTTERSFLVVKGSLPAMEDGSVSGYYLFPLKMKNVSGIVDRASNTAFNNQVLVMLDEVNQIHQIERLWRFPGPLSLTGYRRLDTNFNAKPFLGNLNQGLKVGGLLIYTSNPSGKTNINPNHFGFPFYNPHTVDLDNINRNELQALQIKIDGSFPISSQASVYGGLDFLYRDVNLGFESFRPSDAKASAGVQYQFNDYLTVLAYQSFVNSQPKNEMLSTTSIGVEYNKWMTLWLAYQYLNFDEDPTITGALSIRF
ncbi:hypothetical protein EDC14_102022 [Hydrogenispora ethanolica]|jgi:hypothetical protein|uniref:SLH domain-containing protein n=2 Tax=Hydrogenispora ethanolica TaxID=1082276 RepID=A0A4V2QDB2_HYDET|nr:hypothetical protein EDC14_102022 [Hydrogenispora ethanolica]